MADSKDDTPLDVDGKPDRILVQLTTINKRLDSHDVRMALMEKAKIGEDDASDLEPKDSTHDSEHTGDGSGGRGGYRNDRSDRGCHDGNDLCAG